MTQASADELGLTVGTPVHAVIKAVAVHVVPRMAFPRKRD